MTTGLLTGAQLQREFISPPDSAKPRVWWHWMNGSITQEGIKLDLQWMQRIGVGGLHTFDASLLTPMLGDQRLVFMTPPWNAAFRYAVMLADQMGLEFGIAGSPGWSESGGPWIRPEQGMKKLVWSETHVSGGTRFAGILPQPPGTVGPFQNAPISWNTPLLGGAPAERVPDLYQDVALIAFRLPAADHSPFELQPVVTSSAGAIDATLLWDGDFANAVRLPFGEHGVPAWIELDFGHPQTVQSMSLALKGKGDIAVLVDPSQVAAELQSSQDGSEFHVIATAHATVDVQQTVTFAPATARYFRLVLPTPPAVQVPRVVAALIDPPQKDHQIAAFVLHTTPRVEHFEQKAGFFVNGGLESHPTPHVAAGDAIAPSDVFDLSSRMRPDGSLDWTTPSGRWALLRIGFSLLGMTNRPASSEATGLEVDKLSRAAVQAHMDGYLGRYESILGPKLIGERGLSAMVNDSWEVGAQNWSDELPAEFRRRRGYDLRLWLPALTGRIIGSAEATDQFLWDFRRTLGELLTENHYGQIAASLHQRGMIHYGESHESGRAFIGDGMDVKRDNDVPMGAMWIGNFFPQEKYDADLRESASVAHIYGQNLVAAESMTAVGVPGAAYAFAPENLKPTADRELADGVNRFVVHTSVHQPLVDKAPGFALGPFGQWFSRNETWAEQASPWITYLARSAYLLQQGHFVADVIYYYGQDSNITALFAKNLPPVPEGYAFDFASAHALTKLSVRDGGLVTASGMHYRILALDPRTRLMSLDVLKQIAQLVEAGATVVGEKPRATPSLSDNATEFHTLADALWGSGAAGEHRYGKGRILSGKSLADAVADLKLEPDFSYSKPEVDTTVWFVHRRLTEGDLYFINNRQDRTERIEAQFRVSGKAAELWHADTGRVEPASYRQEGNHTIVALNLDPHDAVFVVFRKPAHQHECYVAEPIRQPAGTLTGPWRVNFQPGRGAPEQAIFTELTSWTANLDPGIKYFSGTASYEAILNAPASWLAKDQRVEIDLGVVKNLAEVVVNGQSAGILWKRPFRIDVTDLLQPGANLLSIRITNLWPNRLIGDKQPNAAPVAFTTFNPYGADSPLLDSGLLGPVVILRVTGTCQ
jgi:alpha-L-rhamnosidase/F5/8 type C domain